MLLGTFIVEYKLFIYSQENTKSTWRPRGLKIHVKTTSQTIIDFIFI